MGRREGRMDADAIGHHERFVSPGVVGHGDGRDPDRNEEGEAGLKVEDQREAKGGSGNKGGEIRSFHDMECWLPRIPPWAGRSYMKARRRVKAAA